MCFIAEGAMDLSYMRKAPPSLADLERAMPSSLNGGKFRPTSCRARQKIAVIIPYRDRMMHLRFLLKTLHDVMQRQEAEYGVFVSEQVGVAAALALCDILHGFRRTMELSIKA